MAAVHTSHADIPSLYTMITRTTPKRPLPLPTFWAAQVHVIGEILGARRATGMGAAKTMIRRNPTTTTTTTTMVIRRLDTQRTTTTTGPVRFRGWSGTRDRIRIPHHHQGQVDFLRRPLGIPAMQIRAFHASRPSNLPAPAVIFGLGALLKVRSLAPGTSRFPTDQRRPSRRAPAPGPSSPSSPAFSSPSFPSPSWRPAKSA
mgnify:CR=1 FL=1